MLKVAKFGGSSLADSNQFKKVKDIIMADDSRRIVVVSAPGRRDKTDSKITDLLYLCHAHLKYGVSYKPTFDMIEERFNSIKEGCGLTCDLEPEFAKIRSRMNKDMSIDYLVSRGEYLSAVLMANYLGFQFVDAKDVIFFNYDGKIDLEKSYQAISHKLEKYERLVIPGFYGALPNGKTKTMSRGGSDISGSIAAAAIDATIYENWTDVSGILMADPRIVDDPKPIERITYGELRELAYMGADVLHEDAIYPVRDKQVPLNIRNTNMPENKGTLIMESFDEKIQSEEEKNRFITGISGRRNFSIITVYKNRVSSEPKLMRDVLLVLQNYDISIESTLAGVDCFSVVVATDKVKEYVYDIVEEIKRACAPEEVKVIENISLVATVGRKMMFRPGISGRVFNALGSNDINIRMISQGADEISIIVGVDNKDFEKTIKLLYNSFVIK
ncbi:MAG: aspartate kinase [Clostridia bacterium]|nr:aspartate kinase [Clostridia bacterium]